MNEEWVLLNQQIDDGNMQCEGTPIPFVDWVSIKFCGFEVVLEKDGTYHINDTTGG